MKKFLLASLIAIASIGCSSVNPGAGYQAVLIEKPYIFGHGGIDPEPIPTGYTYTALSTDAVYVNMQPEQHELIANDIMTSDGVPIAFDAVIRLQVTDSVALIKGFGQDWYKINVEKTFFNLIRQEVKQHGMNETAISATAIEAIDTNVAANMQTYLTKINIPIKMISITVGKASPPDSVKSQRIETATQQQRILTEGQRKLAEDARKAAEQSRAEADNAFRNAMQMSPDQYLALENINMMNHVCTTGAKCTFISNGSKSGLLLETK